MQNLNLMKGFEMDFRKDLEVFLRSRFTLIGIPSLEEECILDQITEVCKRTDRRVYAWDHGEFFRVILGEGAPPSAKDPLSALGAMENLPDDSVFVLLDFHQCWQGQPRVVRKLRDLAQKFKFVRKSIVLTMPFWRIPDELKDDMVLLEFPTPGIAELDEILSALTSAPGVRFNLTPQGREKLLAAALGLSTNHARRIFSKAIVSKGGLDERDIDLVNQEKKQVVRESGALSGGNLIQ